MGADLEVFDMRFGEVDSRGPKTRCILHHLANINEQFMRGGDAALCQIRLTVCRFNSVPFETF